MQFQVIIDDKLSHDMLEATHLNAAIRKVKTWWAAKNGAERIRVEMSRATMIHAVLERRGERWVQTERQDHT